MKTNIQVGSEVFHKEHTEYTGEVTAINGTTVSLMWYDDEISIPGEENIVDLVLIVK